MDDSVMEEREFTVTAAHVEAHIKTDGISACKSCPYWQALRPLIREDVVFSVDGTYVVVSGISGMGYRVPCFIPPETMDAISRYDNGGEFPLGTYRQSLPRNVWKP